MMRRHPGDIMAQDRKVVRVARSIADLVLQQRLGPETQALEQHHRTDLIGGHLRGELFQPALRRDRIDRLEQVAPQPCTAALRCYQQADLSDMGAPAERVAHQRSGAHELAILLGDQAVDPAFLDRAEPGLDHARMFQVAAKEQQVMLRQALRKGDHRVAVVRRKAANVMAHVDLSPSPSPSFGHTRLSALPPATRLTCPPFNVTCSLSREPTLSISGAEAADGTIWSCSAVTWRRGAVIAARSTGRPATSIVPSFSRFSHISFLVVSRKYSPASGSVSLAQRSNMRKDLTYSSFHRLSSSRIFPAI